MLTAATAWLDKTKSQKQHALYQLIHEDDSVDYINLVTVPQGVVASLGRHFDYAIFGRDSIRVAKDLLDTHQTLAHDIILSLARLQGTFYNDQSEEEPGKIHHEHRSLIFDGEPIPEVSAGILRDLQQVWGRDDADGMTYYGSADATPLYVRLVASYVNKYGNELLDETVTGRDGQTCTLRDSLQHAVDWLVRQIEASPWGLLEYKRRNPNGLINQAWKDSTTAYLHADGSMANFEQGIASIELQGYAYDAFLDASKLLPGDQASRWQTLAKRIQETTLATCWMEQSAYFAQGLDRDAQGNMRQIDTLTSNPALLLRSRLLHDLEPDERDRYVEKIVRMLMSPEFLTMGGIRSRALKHHSIPGFPDYHGTYTTWPKETYEIAKGLRYHGYSALGHDLEVRILNSVMTAGEFYEFFYINENGTLWYDPDEARKHFEPLSQGNLLPVPEAGQAWTVSAVMAILKRRQRDRAGHSRPRTAELSPSS